jgi:3-(3-hydroxy-phenyl)propionate hydroxylase
MTPPFMAQGMVQGLRDALNLAWKLERVVRGRSPASLLDSYAQERRPHVVATTRTAMELGRVICERDAERAQARDTRLLAEQGGRVTTRFRQDMIPGLADGLVDRSTPGAGAIVPQPFVSAGGDVVRLDELTGRSWRAVTCGALTDAERGALLSALAPLSGVLVQLGTDAARNDDAVLQAAEDEPVLAPWLGRLGQRFAIVRPDHYVYATAGSATAAAEQLHRLRAALS